eukprot:RCo029396
MASLLQSLLRLEGLAMAGIITNEETEIHRQILLAGHLGHSQQSLQAACGEGPSSSNHVPQSAPMPSKVSWVPMETMVDDSPAALARAQALGFGSGTPSSSTVKVQPVPEGITVDVLKLALSGFGEVLSAAVNAGNPNYGYVRFADPLAAQRAVRQATIQIGSTQARVKFGRARGEIAPEPPPSKFLGLFNLPQSITLQELASFLSNFPGFVDVRMMSSPDGAFRGHAFAEFQSIDDAVLCKAVLSGMIVSGQTVGVRFGTHL